MMRARLEAVGARIASAAASAGRDPASIRLVAVSKTMPSSAIREAYEAGQRDFGENYAQELAQKATELADLADLRWHFIGHLQSNKAKIVAPLAHLVHSVDSVSLAKELAKRARGLAVLVEVNAGEAQKSGAREEDVPALLDAIAAQEALRLRGLMVVPPADPDAARRAFERLARLRDALGGTARLPELSMGMSADLEIAVATGATIVRIGTAIFGARTT
jgi:PLP dependent protein